MTAVSEAKLAWDNATPAQREKWRADMTRRRADKAAHPLAYAKLWHTPRTSQREAIRCEFDPRYSEVWNLGGNRCLAAETMVLLADGTEKAIGDFTGPEVVATPDGPRMAYPYAPKGPDPLYLVTLSTGRQFRATSAHRVLSAAGEWRAVGSLQPGCALSPPGSSSAASPSARSEGAQRCSRTTPDSRSRCSCHPCGEPPRPAAGSAPGAPPSPGDAPARSHESRPDLSARAHRGGSPPTPASSHPSSGRARLSSSDVPAQPAALVAGSGSSASCTASRSSAPHSRAAARTTHGSGPRPQSTSVSAQSASLAHSFEDLPCPVLVLPQHGDEARPGGVPTERDRPLAQDRGSAPPRGSGAPRLFELASHAANRSRHGASHQCSKEVTSSHLDPPVVVSITRDRTDCHHDLRVPGPDCFIAEGVVHHNSGKSEGDAQADVVYALGRAHPDSQRWAKLNGIDISHVQPGPGLVYNGALTFADSCRYVRPKIAKYCPPSTRLKSWDNKKDEAEAILPNGGRIVCKAVTQGRKGWQGDACHRVHFDEEPDDMEVVHEAMVRLVDYGGKACFSMTPLNGWTALLTKHVETPAPDVAVNWLHGADNPHVPTENLERILRKFGAHEQASRRRGEIVALEGRVYIEWDRQLHVVPSFAIPADWTKFNGWDFGTRNPTGIVWLAHDPSDDVIHAYREHYESGRTLAWHATRYHALCGNRWSPDLGEVVVSPTAEEIEFICADSAGLQERMQLAQQYDISTVPSMKGAGSVRDGINRIAARLAPDANGKPHYVVHDCCPQLIKERENYRWDTTKKKGDLADAPLKKGDHLMDGERYAVTYFERSGYV